MGGLIALNAVNKSPSIFNHVVFAGTPFNAAPIILWALQHGVPGLKVLDAAAHQQFRSAFAFVPPYSVLTDWKGNAIDADFQSIKTWVYLYLV